jgi:hypothetical protein
LAERRQRRNPASLPDFTIATILKWADAHRARTGKWPLNVSGPVLDAPGETWGAIHDALSMGRRGLPGGETLAQFLAEHRKVRNRPGRPRLTIKQILIWADAHFRRTGEWPTRSSGPILASGGETWVNINSCLRKGNRGLPLGWTLASLLRKARGVGREGGRD